MSSSIVCGVDDTRHGQMAVRFAAALAERLRLRLVMVDAVAAPERLYRAAAEEAAEFLLISARDAAGASAAPRRSSPLVTAGTAPCPIVVVPPGGTHEGLATGSSGSIVCGIADPGDAPPMRVAVRLARELDLALLPAHVVSDERDRLAATTAAGVRALVSEHAAVSRSAPEALEGPAIRVGEPSRELAKLAEDSRAALLVVGCHGRGGLRSNPLSSTLLELARASRVPLVVCPAHPQAA